MTDKYQQVALAVLKKAKANGTLDKSIEVELLELLGAETRPQLEAVLQTSADTKTYELSSKQRAKLFYHLEVRFDSKPAHYERQEGVNFVQMKAALEARPALMYGFAQMAETGGKPDVIGVTDDAFVIADCSKESPNGRRKCVYNKEAEKKSSNFDGNAIDMAEAMGVLLMDDYTYKLRLQKIGLFDANSWNWLATPGHIGKNGKALVGMHKPNGVRVVPKDTGTWSADGGWRGMLILPKLPQNNLF